MNDIDKLKMLSIQILANQVTDMMAILDHPTVRGINQKRYEERLKETENLMRTLLGEKN